MYSPQLLNHFEHPRNAGAVPSPDAKARLQNPACGDLLELTLTLDGETVGAIGFLAKGCVASLACASAVTELARGRSIPAARALTSADLLAAVGGLPPASMHAIHLALDALQAALDQLPAK